MTGAVHPDRQRPPRGNRGVLLAERSRRCIAGVRPRRLTFRCKLLVRGAEAGERHVHLPAHLHARRRVICAHVQGNRPDRAEVRRDVLALHAVAARRAAHEHPVLVQQVDRRAVDLRLEHVRDRLVAAKPLAHVGLPLLQPLVRRHFFKRAHRREVAYLLELRGGRRTDAAGRRVERNELRVLGLDGGELVVERVVRRVLHDRRVLDMVGDQRAVQELAQLRRALGIRGRQAAPPRCRRSRPAPLLRALHGRGSRPT